MQRGKSYITVTTNDNPSHLIVKALIKLGVRVTVVYASHLSTDAGWTIVGCNKTIIPYGGGWLGYTKSEALDKIKKFKIKGKFLYV